jgi:hypothetical protein
LLNKLEKQELLKSTVKLSGKNVAQKVYTLTAKGKKLFKSKLSQLLTTWEATKHPLDIGLAGLWMLEKKEAVIFLNRYGKQLDQMLTCYKDLENFLKQDHCPPGNVQLATRRLFLLEGEKKWLQAFISELSK